MEVEPLRDEKAYYPQLGIVPPGRLTLLSVPKKKSFRPVVPGTPAAAAKPEFEQGDRIVAMTDPADPEKVTPLPEDPKSPDRKQPDFREYSRRMVLLAGKPVTFHVLRKDDNVAGTQGAQDFTPWATNCTTAGIWFVLQ